MSSSSSSSSFWLRRLFSTGALAFAITAVASACSDQTNNAAPTSAEDASTPEEDSAAAPDTSTSSADSGLTGKCADAFGDKLTAGFGRIDGIVWAVQKPSDTQCVMPNKDHLIVQVLMNGAVYRLVANVESDRAQPDGGPPLPVRMAIVPHALPAPAFAEGWHTLIDLDYPTTLDAHTDAFAPGTLDELVAKIAAEIKVGDPISVYATSGNGRPESAHLIHRNGKGKDGAIVVSPKTSSPKFLLFQFGDQVF